MLEKIVFNLSVEITEAEMLWFREISQISLAFYINYLLGLICKKNLNFGMLIIYTMHKSRDRFDTKTLQPNRKA